MLSPCCAVNGPMYCCYREGGFMNPTPAPKETERLDDCAWCDKPAVRRETVTLRDGTRIRVNICQTHG